MVELQLCTGMRADNVTALRACEIDTRGKPWDYEPPHGEHFDWIWEPEHHKTEHLKRRLRLPLGPRVRQIVREFSTTNLAAYLFRPTAACAAKPGPGGSGGLAAVCRAA